MGATALFDSPAVIVVLASTLALLALFLVANGIAAWYEERTRRVSAAVRKGAQLPAGLGTFHGVAQNLDTRSGGELVRRERSQVSAQSASGAFWRDLGVVTTGRPFVLTLESGVEIEIDGREPRLVGFPETSPGAYTAGPIQAPRREMIARVSSGDEVWATGVLARPPEGGGAYRSSLSRRKLRAPRRGEIELSASSPVERWKARASAHKRGAFTAALSMAILHGVFFRQVDKVIFAGRGDVSLEQATSLKHSLALVIAMSLVAIVATLVLWFSGIGAARKREGA